MYLIIGVLCVTYLAMTFLLCVQAQFYRSWYTSQHGASLLVHSIWTTSHSIWTTCVCLVLCVMDVYAGIYAGYKRLAGTNYSYRNHMYFCYTDKNVNVILNKTFILQPTHSIKICLYYYMNTCIIIIYNHFYM